ncbi:MAG: hypothetical protein WC627_11555 [Legionella sp.]|jgi:hypothetical protein
MARLTDAELNDLKDIVKKRQAELASQRMQETAGKEQVATDAHVAQTVADLEEQISVPAAAAVVKTQSEPVQPEPVVTTNNPVVVADKSAELKTVEENNYIEVQKNKANLAKNRVVRPRTGKKATTEVTAKQSDAIQDQSETTKQPEQTAAPLLKPSVSSVPTSPSQSSHFEIDSGVRLKDTKNNLYKLLRTKPTDTQSEITSSSTPSSLTTSSPLNSRESTEISSSNSSISSTLVHTGASDSKVGDLKNNLIKAVLTAEQKYREYHKDNNAAYTRNHKESHYSFFSWLRHGDHGLKKADTFKKSIQAMSNAQKDPAKKEATLEDVISALNTKLTDSKTRYHRHSFGSYLLDEIKKEVLAFRPDLKDALDTGSDDKYAYNNKNVTFAWLNAHEALEEKVRELAGSSLSLN